MYYLIQSCSKDKSVQPAPPKPKPETKPNGAPKEFKIEVSQITKNSAKISWATVVDPDNDTIQYSIYLNDIKIKERFDSTALLITGLKPETEYTGKVVAQDVHNNARTENYSFLTKDAYLKFDRVYSFRNIQSAFCLSLIRDKGYVVGGKVSRQDGNAYDFLVIKFDSLGNAEWHSIFESDMFDKVASIKQIDDGYLFTGNHLVMKLNDQGQEVWRTKLADESYNAAFESLIQTKDNQIVVVGNFTFNQGFNKNEDIQGQIYFVKLDANGKVIGRKNIWEFSL